jgi:hypothetical protein
MLAEGKTGNKFALGVVAMLVLGASGLAWVTRSAAPVMPAEAAVIAASTISPLELMRQHSERLPTESWDPH